jgi:hypothetical protein
MPRGERHEKISSKCERQPAVIGESDNQNFRPKFFDSREEWLDGMIEFTC